MTEDSRQDDQPEGPIEYPTSAKPLFVRMAILTVVVVALCFYSCFYTGDAEQELEPTKAPKPNPAVEGLTGGL